MAGASKSIYQRDAEKKRAAEGGSSEVKAERSEEQHEAVLSREKYDPAMKGGSMSQSQVQASGGLGAYAKAHQAAPSAAEAANALAKRKPK